MYIYIYNKCTYRMDFDLFVAHKTEEKRNTGIV